MISKTVKFLGNMNGSAGTGAKLFLECTPKGCYNYFLIRCKSDGVLLTDAQIATYIGNVEAWISGSQKINIDATVLNKIASRMIRGFPADSGMLAIPLYTPFYDIYAERYNFAWACADVQSVTLNVNTKGLLGSAMTFEVFSDWDIDDKSVLGPHICYASQTFDVSAGSFDNSTVNAYGDGTVILGHYVELIGGVNPTIDKVIIDVNGNVLVDNWSPDVNIIANGFSKRESGLGTFALELLYDGANKPTSSWFMRNGNKLRFRCELGDAGGVDDAPATKLAIHTMYAQGIPLAR